MTNYDRVKQNAMKHIGSEQACDLQQICIECPIEGMSTEDAIKAGLVENVFNQMNQLEYQEYENLTKKEQKQFKIDLNKQAELYVY